MTRILKPGRTLNPGRLLKESVKEDKKYKPYPVKKKYYAMIKTLNKKGIQGI